MDVGVDGKRPVNLCRGGRGYWAFIQAGRDRDGKNTISLNWNYGGTYFCFLCSKDSS